MIEVKKHGNNNVYQGTCTNCGCEIECTAADVNFESNITGAPMYVICPECGNRIMITSYTIVNATRFITSSSTTKEEKPQPQSRQEWSEEDETVLNNLIYALANDRIGNNRDEYVDWLKSLKARYTWKPSDEQMASITCAVRKMKESACYDSELVSLFNDLKKLRDE